MVICTSNENIQFTSIWLKSSFKFAMSTTDKQYISIPSITNTIQLNEYDTDTFIGTICDLYKEWVITIATTDEIFIELKKAYETFIFIETIKHDKTQLLVLCQRIGYSNSEICKIVSYFNVTVQECVDEECNDTDTNEEIQQQESPIIENETTDIVIAPNSGTSLLNHFHKLDEKNHGAATPHLKRRLMSALIESIEINNEEKKIENRRKRIRVKYQEIKQTNKIRRIENTTISFFRWDRLRSFFGLLSIDDELE